ncbi:uncharacterized protein LOC108913036, partial [Anoplophora glabripennis]|uniref:uncharacterized protein LOC108913036 n=1 Tax=Anoplophora glabripennis TaxID=217634 RepID=UPI00087481CF
MAYVIWRVVMKKYSRVRLGLHGSGVTPTGGRAITYDEESWKPSPEDKLKEKEDFNRLSEARQSKTKRVKNYFKKCKNALGTRSASLEVSSSSDASGTSSWYVENKLNECEVNELEEIFEDAQDSPNLGVTSSAYQVANIIEVKGPNVDNSDNEKIAKGEVEIKDLCCGKPPDEEETKTDSSVPRTTSPSLKKSQDEEEGEADGTIADLKEKGDKLEIEIPIKLVKSDVEILVDKYFGSLYKNYEHSRKCLIRQARDLLVCEYHGCLQRFENEFCVQAEKLLQHLK